MTLLEINSAGLPRFVAYTVAFHWGEDCFPGREKLLAGPRSLATASPHLLEKVWVRHFPEPRLGRRACEKQLQGSCSQSVPLHGAGRVLGIPFPAPAPPPHATHEPPSRTGDGGDSMRGVPPFLKASGTGDVPRQPSRPPRPRAAGRLAAAGGMAAPTASAAAMGQGQGRRQRVAGGHRAGGTSHLSLQGGGG